MSLDMERFYKDDADFDYYSYANIKKRAEARKSNKHQVMLPEGLKHEIADFTIVKSERINYFNKDWKKRKYDKRGRSI